MISSIFFFFFLLLCSYMKICVKVYFNSFNRVVDILILTSHDGFRENLYTWRVKPIFFKGRRFSVGKFFPLRMTLKKKIQEGIFSLEKKIIPHRNLESEAAAKASAAVSKCIIRITCLCSMMLIFMAP